MEELEQLQREVSLLKDQLSKSYQDSQLKDVLLAQLQSFLEEKNIMMEFLLFQSSQCLGTVIRAETSPHWDDDENNIPF